MMESVGNPGVTSSLRHGWGRLSPGLVVFWASLAFSLVAIVSDPVLNRDGMLYIGTAQTLIEDGFAAAFDRFNWAFFPAVIAGVSRLLWLDPEIAAYLVCALFLAGTCYYLVRITNRLMPGSAWMAVVVLLCLPALNEYRPYVIRGFGAWFFLFWGLHALLRWHDGRHDRHGLIFQTGVGFAGLFRPELWFVYPATFVLWPWWHRPGRLLSDLLAINGLWLAGGAVLAVIWLAGLSVDPGRVGGFIDYLNISRQFDAFGDLADRFGEQILNSQSRDEAGFILFSGLLALIPLKLVELAGVLALPLCYFFRRGVISDGRMGNIQPLPGLAALYIVILILFILVKQFLSARYAVLLALLLVPAVVEGMRALAARRWRSTVRYGFIVLLVVTAGDGLITTGDRKIYLKDAGAWIQDNGLPEPVYFDESQQRYYAGYGYREKEKMPTLAAVLEAGGGRYQTLVLRMESAREAGRIDQWLASNPFHQLKAFGAPDRGVRVLVRDQR